MASLRNYDLEEALQRAFKPSSGYWRTECPKCWDDDGRKPTKQNLTFNLETGKYSCWKCQSWGFLNDEQADSYRVYQNKVAEDTRVELPDFFAALEVSSNVYSWEPERLHEYTMRELRPYIRYLHNRGVTNSTISQCRIGAIVGGKHANYVCVPLISQSELKGFVLRSILDKKYWSPTARSIFNVDQLFVETDEPIAIVEGCFDALPHYPNACAMLGKPTQQIKQVLLQAKRPLAIAMDADAQQMGWSLATWLQLEGKQAHFVQLPSGMDPGDISTEDFTFLVRKSCGLK